jgi:hypothetical protein
MMFGRAREGSANIVREYTRVQGPASRLQNVRTRRHRVGGAKVQKQVLYTCGSIGRGKLHAARGRECCASVVGSLPCLAQFSLPGVSRQRDTKQRKLDGTVYQSLIDASSPSQQQHPKSIILPRI